MKKSIIIALWLVFCACGRSTYSEVEIKLIIEENPQGKYEWAEYIESDSCYDGKTVLWVNNRSKEDIVLYLFGPDYGCLNYEKDFYFLLKDNGYVRLFTVGKAEPFFFYAKDTLKSMQSRAYGCYLEELVGLLDWKTEEGNLVLAQFYFPYSIVGDKIEQTRRLELVVEKRGEEVFGRDIKIPMELDSFRLDSISY